MRALYLFPEPSRAEAVVTTAAAAGMQHVVVLSSLAAGEDGVEGLAVLQRRHLVVERAAEGSSMSWTHVRPGMSMTNTLGWAGSIRSDGVVREPYPDATAAPAPEDDVAAVAVAALLDPERHAGAAYPLSGPVALSQVDRVRILAEVLGRPVRFEEQTREQARERMPTIPWSNAALADALLDLHTAPEVLVLANVWDVVSARTVAATSGYADGENIPLALHLDMVGRIVAAVDLPVTTDLEAGYGDAGATARRAIGLGVVGGNLEDQMKPLDEAVAAVEAVLAAGRDAGIDFVLNARTDAVVRTGDAPCAQVLEEAVRRGRAFLEAGAPVVFVPGLVDREEIRTVADALGPQRLSVISVPGVSLPTRELEALGVARVSTGPFTQRVALTALQDAAAVVGGGTLPATTRPLS